MEQQILFLINRQWTSPELDLFMAAMSSFALWTIPMLAAITAFALFGGFKGRAMLVVLAVAVVFGGNVICEGIKRAAHRPRPRDAAADVRIVDLQRARPDARDGEKKEPDKWTRRLNRAFGLDAARALFLAAEVRLSRPQPGTVTGRSFPSAHAFNNFCIGMVLALFYRRWGWLYFIPAGVVAWSRLYVGAHWPGDVVAGAFLGCGCALLATALLEFLWRKFGGKIMPLTRAAHPGLLE